MLRQLGRGVLTLAAFTLVGVAIADEKPVTDHRVRLLHKYDIVDKEASGEVAHHVEVMYDYTDRVGRILTYDAKGDLVKREDLLHGGPHPSTDEIHRAEELLLQDADLAMLLKRLDYVFEGGFLVERESGPCGPGTRCVEIQILAAPYRYGLIKKVLVDLVAERIVVPQYNAELLDRESGVTVEEGSK